MKYLEMVFTLKLNKNLLTNIRSNLLFLNHQTMEVRSRALKKDTKISTEDLIIILFLNLVFLFLFEWIPNYSDDLFLVTN